MKEPEKECPECKGKLNWKIVYGSLGKVVYNGLCSKCNIILRGREIPEHKKGREIAEELIGVGAMDKEITKHSGNIQVGILRARHHCRTCGCPSYPQTEENSCKCINCSCLYCREYKGVNDAL